MTREELVAALRRADAAGDSQAAQAIVRRIDQIDAQPRGSIPAPRGIVPVATQQAARREQAISSEVDLSSPDSILPAYRQSVQSGDELTQRRLERAMAANFRTDPTAGMNAAELSLAGGPGKFITDIALSARQLSGSATPAEAEEKRRLEAPIMRTVPGFLGSVATDVAAAAAPVPGSSTVRALGPAARAGELGVRSAALEAAKPVGEGESRGERALVSGALGTASYPIGAAVGRALGGTTDPVMRRSLQFAENQGIPVYAAQATQNVPIRAASAGINSVFPFTGAQAANEAQQSAFNRALARSFGIDDAADLGEGTMLRAQRSFDQRYTQVFGGRPVVFDTNAASSVRNILAEARQKLSQQAYEEVKREADGILANFSSGSIDPAAYQSLRSEVFGAARQPGRTGNYIRRLARALDDTAKRSLPNQEAVNQFNRINADYNNFKVVETALSRVAGAGDNVSPAQLWTIVNSRNRARATPEMREFARLGQNVLKETIPNSGTAQRGLVAGGVISAGQAMAQGGAAIPDPATILAIAGLGAAGGRVLNSRIGGRMLGLGLSPRTARANQLAALLAPNIATQTAEGLLSNDYYIPPQE